MGNEHRFYIDGRWVDPAEPGRTITVVDPATEQEVATVASASDADVEAAITAAHRAFPAFSTTPREDRLAMLERLLAAYSKRVPELAATMTSEIGVPASFSEPVQARIGERHLQTMIDVLRDYDFTEDHGTTRILREPVGVCALIAPWNWPMNQIVVKVAPALAAGCAMVLKPSQLTPLSALLFAEAVDEAGVPAGVFNMINGPGSTLGAALSSHALVDMVSVTGSTEVGAIVAAEAAPTIKRVSQELGGKSANIVFEDVDLQRVVGAGVRGVMRNSGQTCNAPTRMLVAEAVYDRAVALAAQTAESIKVGDPRDPDTFMGPVAGKKQYDTVRGYIQSGLDEGARLAAGGLERPHGPERGFFVRPTVFADVRPDMRIFREEIFGPVVCLTPFTDEDEAVALANDSDFGLSGYVSSGDLGRAQRVAGRMRTGMVHLNGVSTDMHAPFGGCRMSGNGREWGRFGLEDFLEYKAIMGYGGRG